MTTPIGMAACSSKELKSRRTHLLNDLTTVHQCTTGLYFAPKDGARPNQQAKMCIEGVMCDTYHRLTGKGKWVPLFGDVMGNHSSRVRSFELSGHRSHTVAPDDVYDFFGLRQDDVDIPYDEEAHTVYPDDEDDVFTDLIEANDAGTTFATIRTALATQWRLPKEVILPDSPLSKRRPITP